MSRQGVHALNRPKKWQSALILAAALTILGTSVFFRVWHLGNIPGLNGDEADYGVNCIALLHGESIRWHTVNGNLLNPLYYIPCILLHAIFPRSIVLLRSLAVVFGLLALVVNYGLGARVFGRRTAVVSTLILAVLPVNIAQGRFGWDPAEILLADVFVVYLSLLIVVDTSRSKKWLVWSTLAASASLFVHPTNIFLTPFLIAAVAQRWPDHVRRWYTLDRVSTRTFLFYSSLFVILIGCLTVSHRLWKKLWYPELPLTYSGLFSGVTTYQDIAGSLLPHNTPESVLVLWSAIPSLILAATALYGISVIRAGKLGEEGDRLLYIVWLISSVLFVFVSSPRALDPGYERYAFCLILPGSLAVTRAAVRISDGNTALGIGLAWGGAVICYFLLGSFYVDYFRYIETTGGTSVMPYRTAQIDPKLAAWNLIRTQEQPGAAVTVVTSEYWNFMPLWYFSETDPKVTVFQPASLATYLGSSPFRTSSINSDLWSVEFDGSDGSRAIQQSLRKSRIPSSTYFIRDYAGRPVLDVVRVSRPGK